MKFIEYKCSGPEKDGLANHFLWAYGFKPIWTYVIECHGSPLLKIGKSKYPEWRLTQLQSGCPYLLQFAWVYPCDIESELHSLMDKHRVFGEWFNVSKDIVIRMAAIVSRKKDDRILGRDA